jgi:hypothetical protein
MCSRALAGDEVSKLGAQHQAQMANGQVDHLKLALSTSTTLNRVEGGSGRLHVSCSAAQLAGDTKF